MIPLTHLVAVNVALQANHNNMKRILESNKHKMNISHNYSNSSSHIESNHTKQNDSDTDKEVYVSPQTVQDIKNMQEMTKNLFKVLGVDIDDRLK